MGDTLAEIPGRAGIEDVCDHCCREFRRLRGAAICPSCGCENRRIESAIVDPAQERAVMPNAAVRKPRRKKETR